MSSTHQHCVITVNDYLYIVSPVLQKNILVCPFLSFGASEPPGGEIYQLQSLRCV